MKPEQSSLERMRVKGTPTEDIRAWCGFAHKVVELTGPAQDDATFELWLHDDSAGILLDMCDEVDEKFESLRELVQDYDMALASMNALCDCDFVPLNDATLLALRSRMHELGIEVGA